MGRDRHDARVGGSGMVRVGRVGRSGAGACPNLPQRRPGPGSAADKSAEYQRFLSGALARSGPLWQIWTNRAAADPPGRVAEGRTATTTGAPIGWAGPREHSPGASPHGPDGGRGGPRDPRACCGRRGPRRRPRPGASPVIRRERCEALLPVQTTGELPSESAARLRCAEAPSGEAASLSGRGVRARGAPRTCRCH